MPYERMVVARDAAPHIDDLPTRQRVNYPELQDAFFWDCYEKSKDYSLVHVAGFYNVYSALRHIADRGLPGCAVECGCFLGGVAMFMGLVRRELGLRFMEIHLFDTFKGAPAGSADVILGTPFVEPCELPSYLEVVPAHIERVVGSLAGYHFTEGLVEDTLPLSVTGEIALLRLDTDYYSSTRIEFEVLYPRLVSGGVLIVDDYGMFEGARRATDDYLTGLEARPLLQRVDGSVWSGVKP